jgi:uncharacterized membrane protein
VTVQPVTEEGSENESGRIDERALDGPEQGSVHNSQRVGDGKRCRRHQAKDHDGQGIGESSNRPDFMLHPWLMANHPKRKQERRSQKRESGNLPEVAIQSMIVRVVITLLCGVGLYTSLFMLAKSRRARRGEVREPSVVTTPRAHLFGVQNSLLGLLYYPALALAVWFVHPGVGTALALAAAFFAAITSGVLAYSLLFVTRRECAYCWTAHAVNWSLLFLSWWLFSQPS